MMVDMYAHGISNTTINKKEAVDGYCIDDVREELQDKKEEIKQFRRQQFKKGSNTIYNGSIF